MGKASQRIEDSKQRRATSRMRLSESAQRDRRLKKIRDANEHLLVRLRMLMDGSLPERRDAVTDPALPFSDCVLACSKHIEHMAVYLRCAEERAESAERSSLEAEERILHAEECLIRAEERIYKLQHEMLVYKDASGEARSDADRRIQPVARSLHYRVLNPKG